MFALSGMRIAALLSKHLCKMAITVCMVLSQGALAQPNTLNTAIYADNQEDTYLRCLRAADLDPETGLNMAQRWIRLQGGEPAEHCAAASLVGLGDPEEAARRMQDLAIKSLNAPPIRSGLWAHAGRAWMQASEYGAALEALNSALALDDRDSEVYLDRALCHAGLDDYWSAIDDLNQVIDRHPYALEALVLRGSAYRRLNIIDLASDDFDRVLANDPNHVDGLLESGLLAESQGDGKTARKAWLKVLEVSPDSAAGDAVRRHLERLDLNIEPLSN